MGYRNYINVISKEVYLETKDLTKEELCQKYPDIAEEDDWDDDDNVISWYFPKRELPTFRELHCLGKYCDFPIEDYTEPYFSKWECSDTEFSVASQELLLTIIEEYRKTILENYKNDLEKSEEEIKVDIKRKITEWNGYGSEIYPYSLNIENKGIVRSWLYEYAIFELVHIYKTIDWENEILIYSGW